MWSDPLIAAGQRMGGKSGEKALLNAVEESRDGARPTETAILVRRIDQARPGATGTGFRDVDAPVRTKRKSTRTVQPSRSGLWPRREGVPHGDVA